MEKDAFNVKTRATADPIFRILTTLGLPNIIIPEFDSTTWLNLIYDSFDNDLTLESIELTIRDDKLKPLYVRNSIDHIDTRTIYLRDGRIDGDIYLGDFFFELKASFNDGKFFIIAEAISASCEDWKNYHKNSNTDCNLVDCR